MKEFVYDVNSAFLHKNAQKYHPVFQQCLDAGLSKWQRVDDQTEGWCEKNESELALSKMQKMHSGKNDPITQEEKSPTIPAAGAV